MKRFYLVILILAMAFFGYFKIGSRTVEINSKPISTTDLGQSSEYNKNLNQLIDIVNAQNPRASLQELAKRMQSNQVVFQNCHVMAHAIGRTAYKKYQDFNTALQYQDTTCSAGYLHGVIEAKFASLHDFNAAISELKTMCSQYTPADRCWHGTGHGVMFYTGNDLPRALRDRKST